MDQEPIRIAPGAATYEPVPSSSSRCGEGAAEAVAAGDPLAFDPVPVRYRIDGWTPGRQREFIEALAELGVVRWAAARVGMTEQSVNRLRRRADARPFDQACLAAQRIGARRVLSLAIGRAIEGTLKPRFFRGKRVGEERVYDNRLLIAVLPRLLPSGITPEALLVERNWESLLAAIGRGEDPLAAPGAMESRDGSASSQDADSAGRVHFPAPAQPGLDQGACVSRPPGCELSEPFEPSAAARPMLPGQTCCPCSAVAGAGGGVCRPRLSGQEPQAAAGPLPRAPRVL